MGEFLGTGRIATQFKKFKPFKDARNYVRELNLKTYNDWIKYAKSKKKLPDIPFNPLSVYKNNGWIGWNDFLGNGKKPRSKKN
jgi:hypothetical protein